MTRAMKDSGIEWIGRIPEDWEVKRLKNILKERKEKNDSIQTKEVLSLLKDRGVIPYSEKGNIGNKAKEDVSKYKLVYPDDIVVNSMNIIIGSVGKSNYYGAVSPVYYVLNTRNKYDINFYNYVLQSRSFQKSLTGLGNGILEHRMRIPMEKLNNVNLPIPPFEEQGRIASILDGKVERIDAIIADTKQSIEELKQYKQSLITETVTKGLDKNVPMTDSGIEWIGQIPEDWEVVKLKYLVQLSGTTVECNIGDGYVGLENVNSFEGKLNSYQILSSSSKEQLCHKGDILYSKLRPYLSKGFIADQDYACSGEFVVLKSHERVSSMFLLQYLLTVFTKYINATTYGTKMPRTSWDKMKEVYVLVPPFEKQNQISNFLDEKTRQIDQLIQDKDQLIKDYEEYKKSIIYEYVTGKRGVL